MIQQVIPMDLIPSYLIYIVPFPFSDVVIASSPPTTTTTTTIELF